MKKKLFTLLCSIPVLMLIAGGFACAPAQTPTPTPKPTATPPPSPTTAAPAIKLRWAGYTPVGNPFTTFAEKAIEAVRTGSKNQISVDWFPAEQLLKASEIFGALIEGRVELGSVNLAYIEGDIALTQVPGLYGIWKSNDHIRAAMEPLREALQGEFAKKGVYLAAIPMFAAPYHLFSNVGIPYTPADAKGQKIRVAGKGTSTFVEVAGASPVFISAPETYTALQRNTVDGVIFSANPVYTYKLNEVLKYALELPLSYPFATVIANLKWWQGLSDTHRKTIQDSVSQIFGKDFQENNFSDDLKAWVKLRQDLKTGQPTKVQAAAWFKVGEAANQQILKGPGLGAEAQKILDVIRKYER